MTISENASIFFDRNVQDFCGAEDWEGTGVAYRLRATWDDEPGTLLERLDQLAAMPEADKLDALVIGNWSGSAHGSSSAKIIADLVDKKDALRGLKAIFLGDITYEENEISWIEQSDVSPLLAAFAGLELFRVRGGNHLKFSRLQHGGLKRLIVETGGLPRSVVREICRCEFPALEHLELWLGTDNYGFDGGPEDFQPLLTGRLFPKLKSLGLRNSEIADDLAAVLVNAPILQRLEILDLSNGTLSDVGARALLNLPRGLPLKQLNLSHHYMTEPMVEQLKYTLTCSVIAHDGKDPDEEWRGVLVSE